MSDELNFSDVDCILQEIILNLRWRVGSMWRASKIGVDLEKVSLKDIWKVDMHFCPGFILTMGKNETFGKLALFHKGGWVSRKDLH